MALQQSYRACKRQLRAAVTSKDPHRILSAVQTARTTFDSDGYPDEWHAWPRAAEDAATRCRVEGTRDHRRRAELDRIAEELERESLAW